jgi:hypothetical protein
VLEITDSELNSKAAVVNPDIAFYFIVRSPAGRHAFKKVPEEDLSSTPSIPKMPDFFLRILESNSFS